MALRQGADALKEAVEKAKFSGNGVAATWFQWKDGETKILRFLTDVSEIFIVGQHDFVQCHDGKKRTFVCRQEFDAPCELCNSGVKKREMGYGLAVLRQAVKGDDGKIETYQDYVEEVEVEENGAKVKKRRPVVGVVRQSPSNFWVYIEAFAEKAGSLLTRDADITRKGASLDTIYTVWANDPVEIPNLKAPKNPDGSPVLNDDGTPKLGRYDRFTPDLKGLLEALGKQSYYDQHLHGVKPQANQGGQPSSAASGGGPSAAPADDLDDELEFERLRQAQAEAASTAGEAY